MTCKGKTRGEPSTDKKESCWTVGVKMVTEWEEGIEVSEGRASIACAKDETGKVVRPSSDL